VEGRCALRVRHGSAPQDLGVNRALLEHGWGETSNCQFSSASAYEVKAICLHSDGSCLGVAERPGIVFVCRLSGLMCPGMVTHATELEFFGFFACGRYWYAGAGREVWVYPFEPEEARRVLYLRREPARLLRTLHAPFRIEGVCVVPDAGRRELLVYGGSSIVFWDLDSHRLGRRLRRPGSRVTGVAAGREGPVFARYADNTVVAWDVESGEELDSRRFEKRVTDMALEPSGYALVLGQEEGRFTIVWLREEPEEEAQAV